MGKKRRSVGAALEIRNINILTSLVNSVLKIAKHAIENGTADAVRTFSKSLPGGLSESTVRYLKRRYHEVSTVNAGHDVTSLPSKKRGRPLSLGELDDDVQKYIIALRQAGIPINCKIVIAAATGIVKATDRTLLYENGGHLTLTKTWAYSLLKRMGYTKRKASTKTKTNVTEAEFELAKKLYLEKIKLAVADCKIPEDIVINLDQSGINILPSSEWTLAPIGSRRIEIAGLGDKWQVTVTIACTMSGTLLPLQILYAGKTSRCHPRSPFPEDFDAWHTPNHWATSETTIQLFDKIIIPYIARKRRELELPEEHMALVILDAFRGHTTPEVRDLLLKNNIITVFVPSNCCNPLTFQ